MCTLLFPRVTGCIWKAEDANEIGASLVVEIVLFQLSRVVAGDALLMRRDSFPAAGSNPAVGASDIRERSSALISYFIVRWLNR